MDNEAHTLSKTAGAKIRPQYQSWLKRGREPAQAYSLAYEKVVELVAQAQHMSSEKVKFASREVLQEAMELVTQ